MSGIIASMALMATAALATSVGEAVVVNKCKYEVKLCAVPAAGGGYDEVDTTMSPNETWSQQWTELTNSYGWSIKMNPMDSTDNEILQYEYTFHNDGIIWYDLSEVNGNPWDSNWEITAESPSTTCTPRQAAYRYATDDAYGMQDCSQDSKITVTLCSGDESNDGAAASASSSVAAQSASIATATSVSSYSAASSDVPTYTTSIEAEPTTSSEAWSSTSSEAAPSSYENIVSTSAAESSATPTTFATLTTSSSAITSTQADGAVTVTEVATAVVTNVVTATHYWDGHEHGHHYSARHAHPHARV